MFWQTIANDEFELDVFKNELDKLPSIEKIQNYLQELSNRPVDKDKMIYHYLMLQAGSFGSKQIWIENNKWKNNSFRNYWVPTATSNCRSPVNPMMPMPDTLYKRVENIVSQLSGLIVASKENVFDTLQHLDEELECGNKNIIVYIDPPYMNTTGYKDFFNIYELKRRIGDNYPIYISEGIQMKGSKMTYLLSSGRTKGSISGKAKTPVEEWLNVFKY